MAACSLVFSLLITFRNWSLQLFSDDWIWLLIAQTLDWFRPVELLTYRFSGFWRPTMTLWFFLTRELNIFLPYAQHILSAILLAASGFLVSLLVLKIGKKFWPAIFTMIFAVINGAGIESWIWYSAVGDLLLGIFVLAILLISDQRGKKWFLPAFIFLMAAALCAKETAAVFLPLLIFWPDYSARIKKLDKTFIATIAILFISYVAWQANIGISRTHSLGYGLVQLKGWLVSWTQVLYPKFASLLISRVTLSWLAITLIIFISVTCIYLVFKAWDLKIRVAAWGLIAGIAFLFPPSLMPLSAESPLLASRYLYLPVLMSALAFGLLAGKIKENKLLIAGAVLWSIFSFVYIQKTLIDVYQPLDQMSRAVSLSLGDELRQVSPDSKLIIACPFPYSHNGGYIKAMAAVLYGVDQNRVVIDEEVSDPVRENDILVAWNFIENKFVRMGDLQDFDCRQLR